MQDTFVKDLLVTLACIAKVILAVVCIVKGILSVGIIAAIIGCVAGVLIPLGFTILFVICKIMGVLSLGWVWIIVMLILDGFMLPAYFNNN